MKSKLSKREKVMIYIMILVIILGLGFIIVKQLVKAYYAAAENYESTAFARQNAELAVANLSQKEDELTELTDYCNNNEIALDEAVSNTVMEQKVLKYITDCGLSVNSSSIASSYDPITAIMGTKFNQELIDKVSSYGLDENGETTADPNADPNADPSADPNTDSNADPNVAATDTTTADTGVVDPNATNTSQQDMTLIGEDGDAIGQQGDSSDNTDTSAESNGETDGTLGDSKGLYLTSTFTLELKGTYANFCKYLDLAADQLDFSVDSYSVYSETGDIHYNLESADEMIYYVTVSYYMKNQE